MHKILNVALLGFGYAGKTIHAPLIISVPRLKLGVVCSSDPEKVFSTYPNLLVTKSSDEVFNNAQIDVVVIATPNHTHFDLAKSALLAGKHVVVDKPFTINSIQARQLRDLAEQKGLVLSVFHNRRWDADFLTLCDVIASGKLGKLQKLESNFDRFRPEVRNRWRELAGEGSGLWYDLGPHLLDQALILFGRPYSIKAEFAMQRKDAQATDYFHVLLRYSSMQVILHASMLEESERPRFVMRGSTGDYIKYGIDTQEDALKLGQTPGGPDWGVDPCKGVFHTSSNQESISSEIPNLLGDYRHFYTALRDCILVSSVNPIPLDDAVSTMECLELSCESARLGNEITLNG